MLLFVVCFFKGDAMIVGSKKYHVNKQFSTFDADHDLHRNENCAQSYKGGWWYNDCHFANLNGVYRNKGHAGMDWRPGHQTPTTMAFIEMKFRPM